MQLKKILITGGAGFIGRHLTMKLLEKGCTVTILDNFSTQIHGANQDLPEHLKSHVELVRGDVRDSTIWSKLIPDQECIVHLAAETGTGQSMYQLRHYSDVNIGGTASMLEHIVSGRNAVQSLVVASSRAIYGEGAYLCATHGCVYPEMRQSAKLRKGLFDPDCPHCGLPAVFAPTTEDSVLHPSSFYGITKQVQEQMILMYSAVRDINGFALRYQNVYGPGQSLSNPYTGILAIFSNLARKHLPIQVFEDGKESRDFVYIDDVVDATVSAIESDRRKPMPLNVGSGISVSVSEVVSQIVDFFQSNSQISINGAFREGDIRHNCADLTRVQEEFNFMPRWNFTDGLRQFLTWASEQLPEVHNYEKSLQEMVDKGLMHA